jgi:hypothetical protein
LDDAPARSDTRASHFQSLDIRDLLDARDQFHVHRGHKPNVFSTAIGRYLIRHTDQDTHEASGGRVDERARKAKGHKQLRAVHFRQVKKPDCIQVTSRSP